MSDTTVSDAKINGDGSIAAGTYQTVTLNGAGTVTGDIVCTELRINGAGRCKGSVKATTIVVNGSGTFDGSIQVSEMSVAGTADVHAGLGVGRLRVTGTCAVDGGVAAREVELRGELRVGANLEADKLYGEGRFVVNAMLNVGDIDMRLHGRSSANEIGCERMILRVPEGITAILSAFADRKLVASSIEGDELELINTEAQAVRGARVTLGEGCRVGLVEYTERLQKLAGALVTEERKVEASGN